MFSIFLFCFFLQWNHNHMFLVDGCDGLKWLLTCKCSGSTGVADAGDLLIWDNVMRGRCASAHMIHVALGPYNELECQCKWEDCGPNCCTSVVTTLNEMKGLYSICIDARINTQDWWNKQNRREQKRKTYPHKIKASQTPWQCTKWS